MALNESQFNTISDIFLEKLFDDLEECIGSVADVDLQDGILNIELDDGGVYIINKHGPNKQIWLASPKSGASHYGFDEAQNRWMGTRDDNHLLDVLSSELGTSTGLKVSF